jgi:hypothetical protein
LYFECSLALAQDDRERGRRGKKFHLSGQAPPPHPKKRKKYREMARKDFSLALLRMIERPERWILFLTNCTAWNKQNKLSLSSFLGTRNPEKYNAFLKSLIDISSQKRGGSRGVPIDSPLLRTQSPMLLRYTYSTSLVL